MPIHPKGILYTATKGLNNVNLPEDIDPGYLTIADNISIDKTGNISKRSGYTRVDTALYTSLWASTNNLGCYAVRNGELIVVNKDYSYTSLLSGFDSNPLSFEEVDGMVYYSSFSSNGLIEDGKYRSWGLPRNRLSPTLSLGIGNLTAGTYQVAYTFVRTNGMESGTSAASTITLVDGESIILPIPTNTDPDVISARIYCSTPNGSTLYFSSEVPLGSTATISSSYNLINPLRTMHLDAPPKGSIISYFQGRMYVASGKVLWYSEPFQYELFKLDSNYFEFPEDIVEVMIVDDGIWVGSDKLYYLSGDEPSTFKRSVKETVKIVGGTSTKISGSYVHMDGIPPGYKWMVTSNLGIFMLTNGGLALNLTAMTLEVADATSGTSLFLQTKGNNQYLSILKSHQNPNQAYMGDLVESTIIRNGIQLP